MTIHGKVTGHSILPPPPALKSRQRYGGRFWSTSDMMEIMSIYHGATKASYPRTWQYRTLIAVYRDLYSGRSMRKGYGPDWKGNIKKELIEFLCEGRIPGTALKFGSELIRAGDMHVWKENYLQRVLGCTIQLPMKEAAE